MPSIGAEQGIDITAASRPLNAEPRRPSPSPSALMPTVISNTPSAFRPSANISRHRPDVTSGLWNMVFAGALVSPTAMPTGA